MIALTSFLERPPAHRYRVREIGPPGSHYSVAQSLNAAGDVAGIARLGENVFQGFLRRKGTLEIVARGEFHQSDVRAVNAGGWMAGTVKRERHSGERPVLWDESGRPVFLAERLTGEAEDLNAEGHVVGTLLDPHMRPQAFLWREGTLSMLELSNARMSHAEAINDRGQIVGHIRTRQSSQNIAFLMENGHAHLLGTLGGSCSYANGINNNGSIAGVAAVPGNFWHAFRWHKGRMEDLGTLPGGNESFAHAIDEHDRVVGLSSVSETEYHATLWENGWIIDLNDCLIEGGEWTLTEATDINDRGEIAGIGRHASGEAQAFLLSPATFDV